MILDSHNRIRILEHGITLTRAEAFGKYFSVFPLELPVEDFSISEQNTRCRIICFLQGQSVCE